METMVIVFCMLALAHSADEDAMVLLVLGIPCLLFWVMIMWVGTGAKYDQDGNKIFDDEE